MCRLRNIAMRDYQESVTTGQTHIHTDRRTDRQTDAGQSDPYVLLCFAGDITSIPLQIHRFPLACYTYHKILDIRSPSFQ